MALGASPHPGPCLVPDLAAPSQMPTRRKEVVSVKTKALTFPPSDGGQFFLCLEMGRRAW